MTQYSLKLFISIVLMTAQFAFIGASEWSPGRIDEIIHSDRVEENADEVIDAIYLKHEHEKYLREKQQLEYAAVKSKQPTNKRTALTISLAVILLLVLALFITLLLFSRKTLKFNRILNAQKTELQDMNKRKDQFFSFVAHDLKNPIGNIQGFTELMLQRLSNSDDEGLKRYTGQIRESAKTLNEMIDNLLDWSRLTRGQIRFEPEIIDLVSIVRDTCEYYRTLALHNDITIVNDIHEPVEVYADRRMASAILNNLIYNAVMYNKKHGYVYVSSAVYDTKAEIRIKDTGMGIKGEHMGNLFRIDVKNSTIGHEHKNSSGMGLILTREMVIKNNGDIFVESEYGKGSTFAFTLPLVTGEIKHLLDDGIQQSGHYIHQLSTFKTFPEALKEQITSQLLPQYQKVRKVLSVDDLVYFSDSIIRMGQDYHVEPLEKYGKYLRKLTHDLKFDKILVVLPEFEQITDLILTPELYS